MFDDKFFDDWLDTQAQSVMNKIADGQGIAPEQMMILMLKAQTNHFAHLDIELRGEMKALREDMDKRFEQVGISFKQMDQRFEQMQIESAKRFEQMQIESAKRFEQIDKRFEQVDKRFESLTSRIDQFMVWSFATTLTVGGLVIAAIKFLP